MTTTQNKMLTMDSRIREVYASPVGHDIINKLLMQMGKSEALITNPLVGNLRLKTVAGLVKNILSPQFFDTFLTLLNTEKSLPGDGSLPVTHQWQRLIILIQCSFAGQIVSEGLGFVSAGINR